MRSSTSGARRRKALSRGISQQTATEGMTATVSRGGPPDRRAWTQAASISSAPNR